MNLGEYLANIILEAEDQPEQTIALFPGAFKPPHKGHFDVVEKLLKAADQVVVLVSPKMREGVSADESIAVWNLYKPKFNGSVEVRVAAGDSPVGEVYDVVKNNPDTNFIVAFGKGEINRYKNIEKYPNVKVFDAGAIEGVSATNLRMALAQKNEEEIAKYLPDGISIEEFLQALNTKPEEKPEEVPAEPPPAEPAPEQPLQESPPIEFEKDAYQDYILNNRPKIEKAAAVFNVPIDDMEYAFNGGTEVVLNDDMWKDMENTKSYNMKSLEDAISHALKVGINPKPYIDHIKQKKDIPLPLVLQWQQGKYYLVGGEVILSIYRSLGVIPTVLLATLNLQTKTLPEPMNEGIDDGNNKKLLKEFIGFAIKELGIQKLPSGLTLSHDNEAAKSNYTFGTFNPNNDKIWVYVKNRNMADILRTLAHELVHRKQAEDGRLDYNSGQTGSDIENEANAQAGILLRKFGKVNNNIYEVKKNLTEAIKPENEIFSAYNGRYLFDVTEAYTLIQSGGVKSIIKSFNPDMMHQFSHPEFSVAEPSKVASMKIDYNKPIGIIVKFRDPETEKTEWILIDGNHRTRKATKENKDAKFYVISNPDDVDKFMETNVEQPHKLFIDDED